MKYRKNGRIRRGPPVVQTRSIVHPDGCHPNLQQATPSKPARGPRIILHRAITPSGLEGREHGSEGEGKSMRKQRWIVAGMACLLTVIPVTLHAQQKENADDFIEDVLMAIFGPN